MHRDKHPRLSLADMHPLQASYMSPDGFLASSVDVLAEAPSFSRLRAAIFQRSMPQGDAAHATTLGSQQESERTARRARTSSQMRRPKGSA